MCLSKNTLVVISKLISNSVFASPVASRRNVEMRDMGFSVMNRYDNLFSLQICVCVCVCVYIYIYIYIYIEREREKDSIQVNVNDLTLI